MTVQLPLFNERYVAERLVEAVCAFDWPRDRLEIQVLDDSTDETREMTAQLVARKRAEEGDLDTDGLPGDDPGGAGASRLVTLLPIFRNFLLITIVVIAGMIVLSELGVNLAAPPDFDDSARLPCLATFSPPPAATTRWHGVTIQAGFAAQAPATARAARRSPRLAATSP